jgi:hypothetical protein
MGLCLLSIAFGGACDLVIGRGPTTILGNRGSVFAVRTPNAASVVDGGSLFVRDADLFGLGQVVEQGDPFRPPTGAAIVANDGFVIVAAGTIRGGNALVVPQDPTTPPRLPPGGAVPSTAPTPLAAALVAEADSFVSIEGGTLISGGLLGLSESYVVGPAVSVNETQLRISGGELRMGTSVDAPPSTGTVLLARDSQVDIRGGTFAGLVNLQSTGADIGGGNFRDGLALGVGLVVRALTGIHGGPGCTDIRGGSIPSLSVGGPDERVFIFGTDFNLPLGPLAPPSLSLQGTRRTVSGRFEDGSAFQIDVVAEDGSKVVLATPESVGCFRVVIVE